jgi:hypothetical protein
MYDYADNNSSHRNNDKGLKTTLDRISGKHSLQKAVLAPSHIIRKVLQSETQTLSRGDYDVSRREVPGRTKQ